MAIVTNWIDMGNDPDTSIDAGKVILSGNSGVRVPGNSGSEGSNAIAEQGMDFTPLASIGGSVEFSFDRTYDGSWFDDDFTDAKFYVNLIVNETQSSNIQFSESTFHYYASERAPQSADFLRIEFRRTHTLAPRAGIKAADGTNNVWDGTSARVDLTEVNAGDVSEDTGPVRIKTIFTRSDVNDFKVDVFIDEVHRWTGTFTNPSPGELDTPSDGMFLVHHHNFETESTVTIENAELGLTGPTTNEELFQASYADASAADPKVTALIRPADVQRSIDTDVSNLKDGPNLYTVEAIFDIGELSNLNPYNSTTEKPRVFFVKDDQPGLRDGKNLLLKGYQIRSADPSVPVTCTFWGY